MKRSTEQRSNPAWLEGLRGSDEVLSAAIHDLQAYLGRVLSRVLRSKGPSIDIDEFVQESSLRIMKSLDSFRGDSTFTTWAAGIATRVAYTELRRRDVRDRKHESFDAIERGLQDPPAANEPSPEHSASRTDLLRALENAIASCLTERQRTAILAELRGIPTVEIARRLNTNQNALYKLIHDARLRLKKALVQVGYGADALVDLMEGAS